MDSIDDRKRAVRAELRAMRRELPDREERSARIWERVRALPAVVGARTVMAFASVAGEPDTAPFVEWCRQNGKRVLLPEDEPPPDPRLPDVVIVPGVAFTLDGDRLGQGGGWYDRFLPRVRSDCTTIGVAFEPQIVDELPTEPHDVKLKVVIAV